MKLYTCLMLFCFSCILFFPGYAQENLNGKQLKKVDDVNSAVETGIGLLFGASKLKGTVESVTVTGDTKNKLSVNVSYTGFANNWAKASILNAEKRVIREITCDPRQFTADKTEIPLNFEMTPADEKLESAYLKLLVCKSENAVTGLTHLFLLPKNWGEGGTTAYQPDPIIMEEEKETVPDYIQEGVIIAVKPTPIGSAAQLKDTPTENVVLIPPTKTYKVIENKALYTKSIDRSSLKKTTQRTIQPTKKSSTTSQFKPMMITGYTMPAKNTQPDKKTNNNTNKQTTNKTITPMYSAMLVKPLKLDPKQVEKGAKGPGNKAISLWETFRSDVDFDYSEKHKITNINTDIFPDKNENSGYYYYFPSSYNLKWDTEKSFGLKILYQTADEQGESGTANMYITLTPDVGTKEHAMVEELVKDYAKCNKKKYERLLPIPLNETPKISLSGFISDQFDIPEDKISTTVTGIFDPVEVAWPMSSKETDDLVVALKEVDLTGSFSLIPQGELPELQIPLRISLAGEQTFGKIILPNNSWRNQKWKNELPMPVKMKYLHALVLSEQEGNTVPFIYSWSLDNTEIPVLASANINGAKIPKLIDQVAQRIWVEYSVKDCDACLDKIINDLTSGSTGTRERNIEVVSYGVLEKTNAYVVELILRSKYADPKGSNTIELAPLKVAEDETTYSAGPLYVPEGKTLIYEYKLKIVTDEKIYQSEWMYSNEPSIYLNKATVKNALGVFPGEEE